MEERCDPVKHGAERSDDRESNEVKCDLHLVFQWSTRIEAHEFPFYFGNRNPRIDTINPKAPTSDHSLSKVNYANLRNNRKYYNTSIKNFQYLLS